MYKFEIGETFIYWNEVYAIYDRYIFDNPCYNTTEIRYKIKNIDGKCREVFESDLAECTKVDKDYTAPKMSIDDAFNCILSAAYAMRSEYDDEILDEAIEIAEKCIMIPKLIDERNTNHEK